MNGQREKLDSDTVKEGSSHFRERSETRISLYIFLCETKEQIPCVFPSFRVGRCALPMRGECNSLHSDFA